MKPASYIMICLITLYSCSTPSAPDFDSLPAFFVEVSRGWNFFDQDDFGLSAASFRKAVELDEQRQRSEAYIGLGWSLAMQDTLSKAITNFERALARTPESAKDSVNIFAGLSLAYRDIVPSDFILVRDNALAGLAIDSNFVFEYRRSINSDDLRAVLAEAYFNLKQYSEAAAIADPGNALDTNAVDYQEQLMRKINTLILISREGV